MSEILTESFCERCGTRYTFESARPRVRLKGVKVLSRGLKNFVLSDDTTMDEAMAAARSETDRESTAHQLDAFHKTFNFCMSCRQYTCPNCWNEVEARCQSCAPLPEPAIAAAPGLASELAPPAFPGLVPFAVPGTIAEPASNGANGHDAITADEPTVWPTASTPTPEPIDSGSVLQEDQAEPRLKATSLTADLLSRFRPGQNLDAELAAFERERATVEPMADDVPVEAEVDAPVEAAAIADAPVEAVAEIETPADLTVELVAASEPIANEPVEAARISDAPVEVGAEIEAPAHAPVELAEAPIEVPIEAHAEPAIETIHAAAVDTATETEVEAPVEAAVEAHAEGLVVAPEATAIEMEAPASAGDVAADAVAETEPEPAGAAQDDIQPATPVAADVVEQPTWQITAPDLEAPSQGIPARPDDAVPLQASEPSVPPIEPQWPVKPEWPAPRASAGLPFLGRPAQPKGGIESLWAASNRELVTTPPVPGRAANGIQPCISCGLSLSANARFCRRCGTLQGG